MNHASVDILVLGAGWTSQFLVPIFEERGFTYALTTTTGKLNKFCEGKYEPSKILPFVFQPEPNPGSEESAAYNVSSDEKQYANLPEAKTIIITFPLKGEGQAKKLVDMYNKHHTFLHNYIQLGSTGIYKAGEVQNRDSSYEHTPRAVAEDELKGLGGTVLNLAGLWGDERVPWNWVERVASTKEKLRDKQALHLIHGVDVARACIALHERFYPNERFILTDGQSYDWWQLVDWWAESLSQDGSRLEYRKWLSEIMEEGNVQSLPRNQGALGRILDSSHFWNMFSLQPEFRLGRDTKANTR